MKTKKHNWTKIVGWFLIVYTIIDLAPKANLLSGLGLVLICVSTIHLIQDETENIVNFLVDKKVLK